MHDGREHLLRRRAARHQRRHSPQRGLFVREPGELISAGGGGDRRGDQIRELRQPVLDVVGQRLARRHAGAHRPPELPVDDDRGSNPGADAGRSDGLGDDAGDLAEVLDPGRAVDLREQFGGRARLDRPQAARLERMRPVAPGADDGRGAVAFDAPDHDQGHAQDLGQLPRDGGEDIRRRRSADHEHRDATQRRLLRLEEGLVPALLPFPEGDHGAMTTRHVDGHRHLGHGEARAVAPDEPVPIGLERLSPPLGEQHRALRGGIRRPVRAVTVHGFMAPTATQLLGAVIPQRFQRGRVGEPDHVVGIRDPDGCSRRFQHGCEDIAGADVQAGKIIQEVGHTSLWGEASLRPLRSSDVEARRALSARPAR